MDAFTALVSSLGETTVSYLASQLKLSEVRLWVDPVELAARFEIVLPNVTWSDQQVVVEKMLEIREMFFDDVTVDYVVLDQLDAPGLGESSREADLVLVS